MYSSINVYTDTPLHHLHHYDHQYGQCVTCARITSGFHLINDRPSLSADTAVRKFAEKNQSSASSRVKLL